MSETTMGLYAKMAAIMGELERLSKDGKSDQLRYKFVKDSDVFDTVRAHLAAHNIAFFPAVTGYDQTAITSKNGAAGYHTVISLEFTFVCGDTGETFKSQWAGESDSYDDKGISKAITLAQKTFLLKTFVLSTGDPDDDPDSKREEASHRGQRAQPQKPAPVAKPELPAQPAPKSELDAAFGAKEIADAAKSLARSTCPWDASVQKKTWQEFIASAKEWHKKFWPGVAALGLDKDMVHHAAGVDHLDQWDGKDGKGNTVGHLWYTLALASVENGLNEAADAKQLPAA